MYLFGEEKGKLSKDERRRREQIAFNHDVAFFYARIPGEGWKSWFAKANLGYPFDQEKAALVIGKVNNETL